LKKAFGFRELENYEMIKPEFEAAGRGQASSLPWQEEEG
jgi:hypothetical protein